MIECNAGIAVPSRKKCDTSTRNIRDQEVWPRTGEAEGVTDGQRCCPPHHRTGLSVQDHIDDDRSAR